MISQPAIIKAVPEDTEAERFILGSMLVDESLIPNVRAMLAPDQFFTPAHETICRAVFEVAEREPVCLVSVKDQLAGDKQLASVGHGGSERDGIDYLMELATGWSWDWRNIAYQVKTVRRAAVMRRLLSLSERMGGEVTAGGTHNAADLLETYQRELASLDLAIEGEKMVLRAGEAVNEAIQHADQVHRGDVPAAVMTGFGLIDDATGGMQPGDLWTLAAATSVGKTALALAIAANIAREGGAVLFASVEMDGRALANRLLASLG